jgi:peptide/nickel transport system ATP-binding protein
VHALTAVSAAVWPGETLGLVGESGSGKTTLARTLLGIVAPTEGVATLEGRELAPTYQKRTRDDLRSLQIVFQNPDSALNRRHSVRRILLRSMRKLAGISGEAAEARLRDLASRVRITERTLTQKPVQLSGGLKQRVAIARAFATDADVILMDEPFVSLDQPTRERMQAEVLGIWERKKGTVIFVTHNLEEAVFLGDRAIVLSAKPARILADVPIELPRPRNLLSPEFTRLRAEFASLLNAAVPASTEK